MSITEHHHGAYAGAALFFGALAWGMSTVLGAAYADETCAMRMMISGGLALAGVVLVIIGTFLSWRSLRLLQAINIAPAMPARNARIYLARISLMAAGLFALALLYQLAASGIFSGCER
ncbi:MAG TPA: hypothetical protein VLC74_09050 [Rhizomicrobium sp.]|nr:hypothetical protein [Rhizomicrobium sp.]